MTKRMLCLLLALVTVVALLPPVPQTQAANKEDFEDIITKLYDDFAASIHQDKADEKAIDQLLEPALYGNGSELFFDKDDALTAALYESAMFREVFIKAVSTGIATIQDEHRTRLMIGGNCSWYDFKNSYSIRHYQDKDFGQVKPENGKSFVYYNVIASGTTAKSTLNKCDSAFSLIIGESSCRIQIEQTALTDETATYHIYVLVKDSFDFTNGGYSAYDKKGYNTTFSKLLTLLGPLLGLKEFKWRTETEMTVTVPNTCDHAGGGKYRWEKIDGELTNVTGDGLLENASVKQTTTSTNSKTGVTTEYHFYKLDRGVELRHDAPWYIEFQTNANSSLYLGPERNYVYSEQPQFSKSSTRMQAFEVARDWGISSTGKDAIINTLHTYGLNYVKAGAPKSGKCVYRIENRIAADGTNSLWLLVDGVELGTLSNYLFKKDTDKASTDMGTDETWANGKNFTIRYVFNRNYYFTKNMNLFYLEIDTAGGYQVTEEAPGTCTQGAGVKTTCVLCGLETVESNQPAPGHTVQVTPGKPATCHEPGITDGSVCTVCGEVLQKQTEIPMLTHEGKTLAAKAPTCLEAGLTEGSICALCGDVLVPQEAVPALGHVEKVIQPGTAPTCLFPGTSDATACDRCGTVLQNVLAVPPLGHAYENGKCIRCGAQDPNAILPGDADEDGTLSYNDALLVLRCAVGLETLPPFAALACDVDSDGVLTYNDALVILRTSIGL